MKTPTYGLATMPQQPAPDRVQQWIAACQQQLVDKAR